MFNRAQEFAKNGQTDQAVAMLNRVIKVYKGTPTARECQGGTRSRRARTCRFFSDRPLVVAQAEEPKPAPGPLRLRPSSTPRPINRRPRRARPPWSCRPIRPRWSWRPAAPRAGPNVRGRDRFPAAPARVPGQSRRRHP